jgi:hypothetical protein
MMTRTSSCIALGATLLVVAGCTADRPAPTEVLRAPIFDRQMGTAEMSSEAARHLEADLKGANEVPPHDTRATGEARFRVDDDGNVSYKLFVEDITNPFMAHIHLGPAGKAGPIVVWLFPSTAPSPGPISSGPRDGLLASGTFTAKDFVGPLKSHPFSELLDSIRAGKAYVNVHTSDGTATAGPGNFPGGEIRGQVGPRAERDDHAEE